MRFLNFNIDLSKNRGKAIRAYLALRGIPLDKINVVARGEIKPNENEDHIYRRIFSRKVEIIVDSEIQLQLKSASTYIVTEEDTPEGLAKKLKLSAEDLIRWNDIRDVKIPIGSTIRIFNLPVSLPSRSIVDEENWKRLFFARNNN